MDINFENVIAAISGCLFGAMIIYIFLNVHYDTNLKLKKEKIYKLEREIDILQSSNQSMKISIHDSQKMIRQYQSILKKIILMILLI